MGGCTRNDDIVQGIIIQAGQHTNGTVRVLLLVLRQGSAFRFRPNGRGSYNDMSNRAPLSKSLKYRLIHTL